MLGRTPRECGTLSGGEYSNVALLNLFDGLENWVEAALTWAGAALFRLRNQCFITP